MQRNPMIRVPVTQRIYCVSLLFCLCSFGVQAAAATDLTGDLTDPQGRLIRDATIRVLRRADSTRRQTGTDAQGRFSFVGLDSGEYRLTAEAPGFAVLTQTIAVQADGRQTENLRFSTLASRNESVIVTASVLDAGVFEPDPAQRVMIRDETLAGC
jgi:hypothetical protein